MIDKGANINFNDIRGDNSVLQSSVRSLRIDTAKFLINHGAIVDKYSLATAWSVSMMEFLMLHADEDTINNSGALHYACNGGYANIDLIAFSLARGLNINGFDKN